MTLPPGLVASVSPAAVPYAFSFTNGASLSLNPTYVSSFAGSYATLTGTTVLVLIRFYFDVGLVVRDREPRRTLDLSWVLLFDGTDPVASGTGDSDVLLTHLPVDGPHGVSGYTFGDPSFHMGDPRSFLAVQASVGGVEPTMTGGLRSSASRFKGVKL